MLLSITAHPLHLFIRQPTAGRNGDRLLLPSPLVLGGYVHNAVGINIKGHLDLGCATRGWRDAHQFKLSKHLVLGCHLTFTLEDLDTHLRLVVSSRGEHLALFGGDSGVAVDQTREHTTKGLNTQR
mmetsp:Transcript_129735/g.224240  ORF Transcript_129735/g.224240 Transcript_129735/m.224240 type:complete len:126 (+) Transcript_129735:553-930(+)